MAGAQPDAILVHEDGYYEDMQVLYDRDDHFQEEDDTLTLTFSDIEIIGKLGDPAVDPAAVAESEKTTLPPETPRPAALEQYAEQAREQRVSRPSPSHLYPLDDKYSPDEIKHMVQKVSRKHRVGAIDYMTRDIDGQEVHVQGGQGTMFEGFYFYKETPEKALLKILSGYGKNLNPQELAGKVEVKLEKVIAGAKDSRERPTSQYKVVSAAIKTELIPDKYFEPGEDGTVDRSDDPEFTTIYGEGDLMFLAEDAVLRESAADLPTRLAKAFQRLDIKTEEKAGKIGNKGAIHINPYQAEEIVLKAIQYGLPSTVLAELRNHFRIWYKTMDEGIAPEIYFIDKVDVTTTEISDDGTEYELTRTLPMLGMEKVKGQELEAVLADSKKNHIEKLKIFRDVVKAVDAVHEAGYIHRDIKPTNIIHTKEGKIKILDFGLSTEKDEVPLYAGTVMGTPLYWSPEHIRNDKGIEKQNAHATTDVWSLGCMLYEMLVGKAPLEEFAENVRERIEKSQEGQKDPSGNTPANFRQQLVEGSRSIMREEQHLQQRADGYFWPKGATPEEQQKIEEMNENLAIIIGQSMRYNPEERFQSCAAMANALDFAIKAYEKEAEEWLFDHALELFCKDVEKRPKTYKVSQKGRQRRANGARPIFSEFPVIENDQDQEAKK